MASSHTNRIQARGLQPEITVNGRFLVQRITGVQRYAHEIVNRLSGKLNVVSPRSAKGIQGHLWEQTVLPWLCDGSLLWNPNASGPMFYGRQVVTFHDLFPIEHPEWYGHAYARWYGISMRRLAAQAVHLIAVSEYTKSRLVKVLGRSEEDITVIPNGCHVTKRASSEAIAAMVQSLSLPTRKYILMLSSLEKRKNVGTMLKAWETLHRQLSSDTWLVLAGPQADASVFADQQLSTDLPRVFYTGYVPDEHLSALYSGASLFVFPSVAEGFGLPLLEAMACGVRCIASNTSSLPEVGGDAATYIDPFDVAQYIDAVVRNMPAGSDTVHAPSLMQSQKFSWDSAADRTFRVLQTHSTSTVRQSLATSPVQRSVNS